MTAALVATAWESVFSNAALTAYTDKAYKYDITQTSEGELDNLYYGQEVNFFTYLTSRVTVPQMTRTYEHQYRVEINYYRYKDTSGANYQTVRTAFETIHTTVLSVLGTTWASNVDYWRTDDTALEISSVNIGGDDCWRGKQIYTAYKRYSV